MFPNRTVLNFEEAKQGAGRQSPYKNGLVCSYSYMVNYSVTLVLSYINYVYSHIVANICCINRTAPR